MHSGCRALSCSDHPIGDIEHCSGWSCCMISLAPPLLRARCCCRRCQWCCRRCRRRFRRCQCCDCCSCYCCCKRHSMSSLHPDAENIVATGQRCSTISPRATTSVNLIGLMHAAASLPRDRVGASGVTSATPRTKAKPAGTIAGSVMGSDSAPRSSRSATMSSHSMRAIRL